MIFITNKVTKFTKVFINLWQPFIIYYSIWRNKECTFKQLQRFQLHRALALASNIFWALELKITTKSPNRDHTFNLALLHFYFCRFVPSVLDFQTLWLDHTYFYQKIKIKHTFSCMQKYSHHFCKAFVWCNIPWSIAVVH